MMLMISTESDDDKDLVVVDCWFLFFVLLSWVCRFWAFLAFVILFLGEKFGWWESHTPTNQLQTHILYPDGILYSIWSSGISRSISWSKVIIRFLIGLNDIFKWLFIFSIPGYEPYSACETRPSDLSEIQWNLSIFRSLSN